MSEDRRLNDNAVGLTREQSRAVDRHAMEVLGIPGVVLMENAGINAAGAVFDVLREAFGFEVDEADAKIAVVCGGGNNGGDGYVVARQLKCWGMSPVVYAAKPVEALTGDARVMGEAWVRCGGAVVAMGQESAVAAAGQAWSASHVVVDALLGTGYGAEKGALRGVMGAAVREMGRLVEADAGVRDDFRGDSRGDLRGDSRSDFRGDFRGGFRGRVVALDVPSGMDADTGEAVGGVCVAADLTVTFVAEKAGFGEEVAGKWLGRVVTADIGVPWSAVAAAAAIAGVGNGSGGSSGGASGGLSGGVSGGACGGVVGDGGGS